MSIRREIDQDGDLILVLSRLGLDDADVAEDGEDGVDADAKLLEYEQLQNKEVRVSSKVLMLNSPVFKAMLGGKFKEGTELAKNTGLSLPYSLDLPDDDAGAMFILSQILHNAFVAERPKPIGLARLAFVSDKYECTSALKYCGMVWIRDWLQDFDEIVPPMSDFCHLLVFSYVIDLPLEFSEISWRIFLYHQGPFLRTSEQVRVLADHPLLRHDIIGCLELKRHECCNAFYKGLVSPMTWTWDISQNPCVRSAKALGAYIETLRKSNILPKDIDFATHKFCYLLDMAVDLPKITMMDFPCIREVGVCGCRSNKYGNRNLSYEVEKEARKVIQQRRAFNCLDCLKSEGAIGNQEPCRIPHSST
ncbi:hypothetical protein CORC01_12021 [Colletotrichum orchidophilum]|uniref:BTB domain-containing protein n=1 Tax=Colletotrichum orchidophilum TaxID=1209926 RepID=A0A1G4AU40_9PEZI|nr:uncharacterized protein CORC01_12021 [Colletotrichum orchidophilum]OHE92687.1 hypothetical protein CORC01_12021 [Colletotrichum orchidophilum]